MSRNGFLPIHVCFCRYTFKNKPNQPPFLKTLLTLCWNWKRLITSRLHRKIRFFLLKLQILFLLDLSHLSVVNPKLLENSSPTLMLFFFSLQKNSIWGTILNHKESILHQEIPPPNLDPVFTDKLFTLLSLKRKSLPEYRTPFSTLSRPDFVLTQWQTIIMWMTVSRHAVMSDKSKTTC